MADITTKAGLAMAGTLSTFTGPRDAIDSLIAAIEAEAVRAERARLAAAVRAMVFTKLTLSEDKRVVRAEVWTHDRDQDGLVGRFAVLALLEGEA